MTETVTPIRVLVAEDSALVREVLVDALSSDPRFRVVGAACDGQEAVSLAAQLRPDVIAMDLDLPRLDGLTATRRIMAESPTPIVIISPNSVPDLTDQALQAGAVAVVETPTLPANAHTSPALRDLLTAIRLMAEVKVVRRPVSGITRIQVADRGTMRRPLAIALAASTGGPQAIQAVLQALGEDLNVPVFVVQHMSPGFLAGMVGWLAATCPQNVRLAEHGVEPLGGTVYVAPEDHHLLVTSAGKLALATSPPIGGFRPSANTLFASAAEYYGAAAIGAVLTGMGDDGAMGLAALRIAGACTIAQDEPSAVVYGMPRAAVVAGAVQRVLPLPAIGPTLRGLLGLKSAPFSADPQPDRWS